MINNQSPEYIYIQVIFLRTIYIENIKRINERKARRIAKKLNKISKKEDIVIALSKNLKNQKELYDNISKFGIKILNGKWILKFLILDILEYISTTEEKNLEMQTIAILMNDVDEIIMQQLSFIARKVKLLKIITNSKHSFSYIENELYNKYGIAIQVTNNKQKSLLNTDIILNFDYSAEMINEFKIDSNATIVNFEKKVDIFNPSFKGKNINNYEIKYNIEEFEQNENYDTNILYESYIYRKDNFANIQKQLRQDNVKITKLI